MVNNIPNPFFGFSQGSFRPERLKEIALRFGMDPDVCLENVATARAQNSEHQMELLTMAAAIMAQGKRHGSYTNAILNTLLPTILTFTIIGFWLLTPDDLLLLLLLLYFFNQDRYALLVVDSATALFRTDYTGRGELSERQMQLGQVNKHPSIV